jgi:hypothetical protein
MLARVYSSYRYTLAITYTTTGFPQLQIASVSDEGFIKAFPIDGLIYETFPKLQFKKYSEIKNNNNHGLPCHL